MNRSDRHLADFLNQGATPLVGRREQIEQVLSQRPGEGMTTVLCEGEEGSGKSRFVAEVIGRIRGTDGVVLHLRFLPGTEDRPILQLARALRFDPTAISILGEREIAEEEFGPRLRRLARLRRVTLIVEDPHLLDERKRGELLRLLVTFSDLPMTTLVVSRPTDTPLLPLPGGTTRFEQIAIEPFSREEIEELWRSLFGLEPDREIVDVLVEETGGNPGLLLLLLRDRIAEEVAERGGVERIDPVSFADRSRRLLANLAESTAAMLDPELREDAIRLARLGPLFGREAAEQLVSVEALDRLRFDGHLLRERRPVGALPGSDGDPVDYPESDDPLLGFANRLLYEFLRTETPATDNPIPLVEIVASGLPLYSYDLLAPTLASLLARLDADTPSPALLASALRRISNILYDLSLSTSWHDAVEPIARFADLLDRLDEGDHDLDDETILPLRISLCWKQGVLAMQLGDEEGHDRAIERGIALSADPDSIGIARHRLGALVKDPGARWDDPEFLRSTLDEGMRLVGQFERLDRSEDYPMFLCVIAMFARDLGDRALLDDIEAEYERIVATASETTRRRIDAILLPVFVLVADTPEERDRRREQYARIRLLPRVDAIASHMRDHEIMYLYGDAQASRLIDVVDRSLDLFRLRATERLAERALARRLVMRSALGVSSDRLRQEAEEGIEGSGTESGRGTIGAGLVTALYLADDPAWREEAEGRAECVEELPRSIRAVLDGRTIPRKQMRPHLLDLDDFIDRVTLGTDTDLRDALDWARERRLVGWLPGLLRRAEEVLPKKEVRSLRSEFERMLVPTAGGTLLRVVDTFALDEEGGAGRKISGGRMKVVLALMIVSEIVGRSFDLEEFARRAVDDGEGTDDVDPEAARNNLYVRLHALRKLLPEGAIISETGEAPRIDRDVVDVDLLRTLDDIHAAGIALERDRPLDARERMALAIDRIGTGVPFPNLYLPIIEAARDQVDVDLRRRLLLVIGRLLDLGDPSAAADLAERGSERFVGDEEIAELRVTALREAGRSVEAEMIEVDRESRG